MPGTGLSNDGLERLKRNCLAAQLVATLEKSLSPFCRQLQELASMRGGPELYDAKLVTGKMEGFQIESAAATLSDLSSGGPCRLVE